MTSITKDLREWAAWMRDDGLADDASMLVIIADRIDDEFGESIDKLRGQNAKLRELVRNLYAEWRFAHVRMRYIVLQHEERMRGIEQRMRELGVEVDG